MGVENNSQKLVIFEGLSCSGKTSLVDSTVSNNDCVCVVRSIPRDLPKPIPEYFMQNDEIKFARARNCSGIILMDRGYLSTLVFYTTMEDVKQDGSGSKVKGWVDENIGKTIFKPDYYVFVDVPPEISRERAKVSGRPFDERNLWMTHTDKMLFQYEQYLSTIEADVPLIRLDGTKPLVYLQEQLKLFMDKLHEEK